MQFNKYKNDKSRIWMIFNNSKLSNFWVYLEGLFLVLNKHNEEKDQLIFYNSFNKINESLSKSYFSKRLDIYIL